MKLFSIGALGLANAQVTCPDFEETWPRTTIKLTQEAIDAGNDGCTAGGHDGRLYSKCWVSCEDGYDMIIKNTNARGEIEELVNERNNVGIKCKSTGNWKAVTPFYCREECPRMYKNPQNFAARTLYQWDNGFILRIRIEPEMDLDEWTAVLWFAEAPNVPLSIETYETYSSSTSASQRVSAFCSYDSVSAGDEKKFIVAVVGASIDDLPNMQVRYMPGIHKDLSCIFDDEDFGGTTTTGATTTTGPRDPEDPNFCENENDGFYPHPVCAKYYHCAGGVTNIRECGPGTVWNPEYNVCDWEYNVDTSHCGDTNPTTTTSSTTTSSTTTTTTTTTSTSTTTTSTTTTTTTTSTVAPCRDNNQFCQGKSDGYYRHCKCKKYYQCYQSGRTIIGSCPNGTLWNGSLCDWAVNVNTNNCEL